MNASVAQQRLDLLQKLAVGSDRPKAAQLREIVDMVEAAIARGVTHAALVNALAATGLVFTLGTFRTTLRRIRMRMRTSPAREEPAEPPQLQPPDASRRVLDRAQGLPERELPRMANLVEEAAQVRVDGGVTPGAQPRGLPFDWLTSTTLTREQIKVLSPDQRAARRKAMDQAIREKYFRSPYSGLSLGSGGDPPNLEVS